MDINNDIIYESLNHYITNYKISSFTNNNDKTCFIVHQETDNKNTVNINCISFKLSLKTSISPTREINTNRDENNIDNIDNPQKSATNSNGLGPFSDAAFITIIVVGGIVIVSCLVCGVVCFTKYQKREIRKQWYREREKQKNKQILNVNNCNKKNKKHEINKKKISASTSKIKINTAPSSKRSHKTSMDTTDGSLYSNTMSTTMINPRNAHYSESESTICDNNHKSRYSRRIHSTSIRARSYPRLPPKNKQNKDNKNNKQPSPPSGAPPISSHKQHKRTDHHHHHHRRRKTKISHRSLSDLNNINKYKEEEGSTTDVSHYTAYSMDDITPIVSDKPVQIIIDGKDIKCNKKSKRPTTTQKYKLVPMSDDEMNEYHHDKHHKHHKYMNRKKMRVPMTRRTTSATSTSCDSYSSQFPNTPSISAHYDDEYNRDSTPSSATVEYNDETQHTFCNLVRPSQTKSEINMVDTAPTSSILSRCSFDETEEKKFIVTPIPTPGQSIHSFEKMSTNSVQTMESQLSKEMRKQSVSSSIDRKQPMITRRIINTDDDDDDDDDDDEEEEEEEEEESEHEIYKQDKNGREYQQINMNDEDDEDDEDEDDEDEDDEELQEIHQSLVDDEDGGKLEEIDLDKIDNKTVMVSEGIQYKGTEFRRVHTVGGSINFHAKRHRKLKKYESSSSMTMESYQL